MLRKVARDRNRKKSWRENGVGVGEMEENRGSGGAGAFLGARESVWDLRCCRSWPRDFLLTCGLAYFFKKGQENVLSKPVKIKSSQFLKLYT